MTEWGGFLEGQGTATLVGLVFLNQAGLPIPGELLLLGAGALTVDGRIALGPAFALSVAATLLADLLWFELGRRKGTKVLGFLCRVSLEPDTCVRRTETLFERRGPAILLFAKFVPGLSTVAPPLAGLLGMPVGRFVLLDLLGAGIWVGSLLALGVLFSGQIEAVMGIATSLGAPVGGLLAALVAVYAAVKWWERRVVLRRFRAARVPAAEVHARIGRGEELVIVDLRSGLDFASDPRTLPGARRIPAEELLLHAPSLPRDRDIVLFCT